MEKMRQLWTDDPAAQGGLGAAGRLYTRFWKLNEAAHPFMGASYHVDEKYCEMWTTSRWLSDPHTAHYVVAHEQVGHGPLFHGFLPYMESEFTKANPQLKPEDKGYYATTAENGLDSEYIKAHPGELGVTYEKVASFSQDGIPIPLKQLRDDWEIDKRGALSQLYSQSHLTWDRLYDVREYHLEFHYAPTTTVEAWEAPTGVTIYRQKLSGEAQVARERLMRFNHAIAGTGGLTKYMHDRLAADGHIADNYNLLRNWDPSYMDRTISESFAECTAFFTAPDRSKMPELLVKDQSSPKMRELEAAWQDVAEFVGERAIRIEKIPEGYPYWENV
jgi:hypothetical protein